VPTPVKVPLPALNKPPAAIAMNEHHKRLMAALAPKPIEGVEDWGIPKEPTTPCDPERAVSLFQSFFFLNLTCVHLCRRELLIFYH
jgi:hypothetical protein